MGLSEKCGLPANHFLRESPEKIAVFTIGIALSLFSPSLQAVPADAGRLTGLLRAVGHDGALEVTENPAYLVIPRDKKRYSLAVESSGSLSYAPDLNVVDKESLGGSYMAGSTLAFSAADLFGGNWGLGAAAGSAGNPLMSRQTVSGKTDSISLSSDTESLRLGGALAVAYKFDEDNALGLSFYGEYSSGTVRDIFKASVNVPPLVNVTQNSGEQRGELTAAVVLGYLARSGASEFGLSVIPAGWAQRSTEQDLSYRSVIPSVPSDTVQKFREEYQVSNLLMPQINGGVAHNLFSFLRVYVELGLTAPVNEIDRFGKYHDSKMIRFQTTDSSGMRISMAGGLTLSLPADWLLFAGYHQASQTSDRSYETVHANYYLLRRQTVTLKHAQLGAGYRFSDNIGLIFGGHTAYYQMDRRDSELEKGDARSSRLKVSFRDSGLYLALHYNPGA